MLRNLAIVLFIIALAWAVEGIAGIGASPWKGGLVLCGMFFVLAVAAFAVHQYRTRSQWDE